MADDFAPQVASLIPGVPLTLLPVRLEARFVGTTELRVRIYPDQIHADSHEPELTAAERDAGQAYWTAVFASPDPKKRTTTPWADLCSIYGARRAAWIVNACTPTNVALLGKTTTPTFPTIALRTSEWGRAARAAALPKRWLVFGGDTSVDALPGSAVVQLEERFRKWSNEIPANLELTVAPDAVPPSDGIGLPIQANAKWLSDFDEAERVGMAVRIKASDLTHGGDFAGGVRSLFVVGVDWTQTPDAQAKTLHDLMASHIYTDGLSAIAPGTPTNITADAPAGSAPSDAMWNAALDPEQRPTPANVAGMAADRLWRDLGIPLAAGDLLASYPGANGSDQLVTSHLINALWEGTLGFYATEFMRGTVTDAKLTELRQHARSFLQPGGSYHALRIGKQPYGVLPVLGNLEHPTDAPPGEELLRSWLWNLGRFWFLAAQNHVPRLGNSRNVDADLNDILQRLPVSASYQYRGITTGSSVGADQSFRGAQGATEKYLSNTVFLDFSKLLPNPRALAPFAFPSSDRLTLPLVDPTPGASGTTLSVNYLQALADLARTAGTVASLKARPQPGSVLEAIALNATMRELHRADLRTVHTYMLANNMETEAPALGVLHTAPIGFTSIMPDPLSQRGAVAVVNASQLSRVVIASVTGTQTVRQYVTSKVARGTTPPADYQTLNDMLASVEFLANQPADQIERCLHGVLDAYSHRFDAWMTSIASRRLALARAKKPTGTYVGGFGWLEGLMPANGTTSLGYVHTPSLAQATTTAVLRSGHLAHNDAEHEALDVNLRSDRVRMALTLLDGVAEGQPLAAILGYQFERSLRATSLSIARYILPFRQLVPLRLSTTAQNPSTPLTPSDAIAARDVVDGVTLLQRWKADGAKLLTALSLVPSSADQATLGSLLDRLADTYDAVADVMVAESVHQHVLGNNDRSGAVLAALDRQEAPPRIDFVRTPRTGKHFTHRVLVLIGDEVLPTSWNAIANDARAKGEPRLNAWIARCIGDPARVSIAGTVTGATTTTVSVTLADLGISPLSLALAVDAPGNGESSELDVRVMNALMAKVIGANASTTITVLDTPSAGAPVNAVGYAALRALLRSINSFVTTQRPATANDLSLPQDGNDDGCDLVEIAARADAVAAMFATARASIDAAVANASSTSVSVRSALLAAAGLGVRLALPVARPAVSADADRTMLLAQATAVSATMHTAEAAAAALGASFGTGQGIAPRDVAAHHVARIRALLGAHFPVLPHFTPRNAADLAASIGDRTSLLASDDLAPLAYLQRVAFVRDGVGALSRVVLGAEMLQAGVDPTSMLVAQLPRAAGERWLGAAFGAAVPDAELSIVAASSGVVNFAKPLAGLFCDAWPEVVPNRTETTGLTFHYNSPGARPPQAILVATPPAAPDAAWTTDTLLQTVMDTRRYLPLRGVTPKDLRWLGTRLPAIVTHAVNANDAVGVTLGTPPTAPPAAPPTAPPSTPTSPSQPTGQTPPSGGTSGSVAPILGKSER